MTLEERNEFLTKNHGLIYGFMNKYNLDREEWYGVLAIGLIKASETYDQEKSNFSTYAYKHMKTAYIHELRKKKQDSLNYCLSLDYEYETLSLIDLVGNEECEDEQELKILKKPTNLTKREEQVLSLFLKGHTYQEIGEIIGVSRQCVGNYMINIRIKFKRVNTKENVRGKR